VVIIFFSALQLTWEGVWMGDRATSGVGNFCRSDPEMSRLAFVFTGNVVAWVNFSSHTAGHPCITCTIGLQYFNLETDLWTQLICSYNSVQVYIPVLRTIFNVYVLIWHLKNSPSHYPFSEWHETLKRKKLRVKLTLQSKEILYWTNSTIERERDPILSFLVSNSPSKSVLAVMSSASIFSVSSSVTEIWREAKLSKVKEVKWGF
jgi:hypothetical protein